MYAGWWPVSLRDVLYTARNREKKIEKEKGREKGDGSLGFLLVKAKEYKKRKTASRNEASLGASVVEKTGVSKCTCLLMLTEVVWKPGP